MLFPVLRGLLGVGFEAGKGNDRQTASLEVGAKWLIKLGKRGLLADYFNCNGEDPPGMSPSFRPNSLAKRDYIHAIIILVYPILLVTISGFATNANVMNSHPHAVNPVVSLMIGGATVCPLPKALLYLVISTDVREPGRAEKSVGLSQVLGMY